MTGPRTYYVLAVALVILLHTLYPPLRPIPVSAAPADPDIVGYGWNTPLDPMRVYPGSSKVTYYVTLMYLGGGEVVKVYAELYLPDGMVTFSEGFKIARRELDVSLRRYDTVTLDFQNINISSNISPGRYHAELRLTYVLIGGAEYRTTLYVPMYVSPIPLQPLVLVDYYWLSEGGTRRAVAPGFRHVDLLFYLRVREDTGVRNVYATILLPPGITSGGLDSATYATSTRYGLGDLIELRFRGIEVGSGLGYGTYNATLVINLQLDLYGLSTNVTQVFNVSLAVSAVELASLELTNAFWGRNEPIPVFPNTSDATVSLVLANVGYDVVYGLSGTLELPKGFRSVYNATSINFTIADRLPPGGIAIVAVPGVSVGGDVEPGAHRFKLTVSYFRDVQGSSIRITQDFNVSLEVLRPEDRVGVLNVRWTNSYGIAFPGSRGEEFEVVLANWDMFPVDLVGARVEVPEGIEVSSLGGNCFDGIPSYSTCSLRMLLNLADGMEPGAYKANVTLAYAVRLEDAHATVSRRLPVVIRVWDPALFGARLEPATVVWGDEANPRIALPGSRVLQLTVRLVNTGKDAATGVTASVDLPEGLTLVYPGSKGFCDRVERGSSCLVRFYVDIDASLAPGTYNALLTVGYVTYFNNANLTKVEKFSIPVKVEEVPRNLKLHLVEGGWSNRWPAYPGDKPTLSVKLANLAPHTISSVMARLELPEGVTCAGRPFCEAYHPGPVAQYQQLNLTYSLELSQNLRPGTYTGRLIVDYVIQSGGYGIKAIDTHEVQLQVDDVQRSFSVIGAYWVNTTPSAGDVGLLRIVLRNDEVPSARGLVVTLYLPEGLVAVPNNSSRISVPYYGQAADIGRYLGVPLPVQPPAAAAVSRGDIVYVDIPVRVLEDAAEGTRSMMFTLEFLDHWLSMQRLNLSADILVGSKFRPLYIAPVDNVVVAGRAVTTVRYKIVNQGSSPLYNLVVVATIPYAALGIVNPVKFFDVVQPASALTVDFNVTANPEVVEGPYPIIFVTAFQDFSGRFYTMNLTSALVVEGLTSIRLLKPQLSPSVVENGSLVTFSATLVNEGKAPLRHAEVSLSSEVLESSDTHYIGNIDPGAQVPISVDAVVRSDAKPGLYTIKAIVKFYDVFYRTKSYESEHPVTVVVNVTRATSSTPQPSLLPPTPSALLLAGATTIIVTLAVLYLAWFKKRAKGSD